MEEQSCFTKTELKVLFFRRIGRPLTLEETGRLLGMTRERVRQIEHQGVDRWRGLVGREILDQVEDCHD